MRVLVVKTSSLGDVIHLLPALTDAQRALPQIQFDWLVEEAFADIPRWHSAVDQVIPVALRRWRKQPLKAWFSGEWTRFKQQLQQRDYALVIDAQGLLKSALLSRLARGKIIGLDRHSAKEPLAALWYQQHYFVQKQQHAVKRNRQLLAQALDYRLDEKIIDYGIKAHFPVPASDKKSLLFFHATTWDSKHWPEIYWIRLAQQALTAGYRVLLPWQSDRERQRALRIQQQSGGELLPAMTLSQIATTLTQVAAVVGVDTGLSHLAAALGVPCISLYGATRPALTGTWGRNQQHLFSQKPCAPCLSRQCSYPVEAVFPPCYQDLNPSRVWQQLRLLLDETTATTPR